LLTGLGFLCARSFVSLHFIVKDTHYLLYFLYYSFSSMSMNSFAPITPKASTKMAYLIRQVSRLGQCRLIQHLCYDRLVSIISIP
jgi:hypothetical protein